MALDIHEYTRLINWNTSSHSNWFDCLLDKSSHQHDEQVEKR